MRMLRADVQLPSKEVGAPGQRCYRHISWGTSELKPAQGQLLGWYSADPRDYPCWLSKAALKAESPVTLLSGNLKLRPFWVTFSPDSTRSVFYGHVECVSILD